MEERSHHFIKQTHVPEFSKYSAKVQKIRESIYKFCNLPRTLHQSNTIACDRPGSLQLYIVAPGLTGDIVVRNHQIVIITCADVCSFANLVH